MVFSSKYKQTQLFFKKKIPSKVLLFHIFWYTLDQYWCFFSVQKVHLNLFSCCPIVKSMTSLYKLNTRSAGPISFHKLCNFWTAICWYRHIICHYGLPFSLTFSSISPAYCPYAYIIRSR